jgi:hypothetical protein
MTLAELQRSFLELITGPLTARGAMRPRTEDGRSVKAIAAKMIRPSKRQSSFERLELYSTGYWARILNMLDEDFVGLRAIVGKSRFDRLAAAYLADCPPPSDLRDLGAQLEGWLAAHKRHAPGRRHGAALDMIRLEYAEIEAADAAEWQRLSTGEMARIGARAKLALQPHLRLLHLSHPVDDVLLAERGVRRRSSEFTSNAALQRPKNGRGQQQIPLPKPQTVYLAVHRHDDIVHHKRLERGAFLVLRAIQAGHRLSDAMEAVAASDAQPTPDQIARWFSDWSALGWFCRAPRRRP